MSTAESVASNIFNRLSPGLYVLAEVQRIWTPSVANTLCPHFQRITSESGAAAHFWCIDKKGVGLGGISQLLKYVRECGASGARVVFFNQPLFFAGGLHPTVAAQIRELAVSNGLALVVSVETRMTFANNKAEADPFTALYGGAALKKLKESVDGLALFIPNRSNTQSTLIWKPREGDVENWGLVPHAGYTPPPTTTKAINASRSNPSASAGCLPFMVVLCLIVVVLGALNL